MTNPLLQKYEEIHGKKEEPKPKLTSKIFNKDANSIATLEGISSYGSSDPWMEVLYSWEQNGEKFTNDRDAFGFQCRYCLIVE
jgi:hypothetical protein